MNRWPLTVRVGTDVESVDEIELSIRQFGSRYTSRVFTDHELESCGGLHGHAAPGLAARFAAKEATIKMLSPEVGAPPWRSIEVRRQPGGRCDLVLLDEAEALAARQGVQQCSLSMSHGAGVGLATVVALCYPTTS